MGIKKELSPLMQQCKEFIQQHGSIVRYQGGYWNRPGCKDYSEYCPGHFGAATVHGLVIRDVAEYSEFKESRTYRFPIAAKLKEATA